MAWTRWERWTLTNKQLDTIAALVAKCIDAAIARGLAQTALHAQGKAINAHANIDRFNRKKHLRWCER